MGGTFNPIHKGHIHLARQAKKKLSLDRVLFVPAFLPPHKEDKKSEIARASYRHFMLKRALKGESSFKISDFELKKKRKVYTIETLRELRRHFPRKTEFFLLTGADNLNILNHWKDLRKIFKLCRFVVATRPGFKSRKRRLPQDILWLAIPPLSISSTDIRKRIKAGKPVAHLLPPKITELIRKKELYQTHKNS